MNKPVDEASIRMFVIQEKRYNGRRKQISGVKISVRVNLRSTE